MRMINKLNKLKTCLQPPPPRFLIILSVLVLGGCRYPSTPVPTLPFISPVPSNSPIVSTIQADTPTPTQGIVSLPLILQAELDASPTLAATLLPTATSTS